MGDIIFKIINVSGGLGLFLLGMKLMGEGLELAAGSKLRTLLEKITSKKFIAMLVGVMVTAVIQSSSATDAMVVGFVNAGLMDIYQSIGILFGSKIGTTATSLLLSFDIKAIVPIFAFAGAVVITFAKKNNYRYYGQIAAGFGILFMGMGIMSDNFDFLKESELFANTVATMSNPILGLLVGMIFTGIIQSSSASVGILMALGMSGVVGLDECIYIIFGMNVGACMPVFLSAAGANRESKQVALSNFLTSFLAALLLSAVCMLMDASGVGLPVIAESVPFLKGNTAAQISAVHIAFNVARTIVFLPLSNLIIKLTKLILPDKADEDDEITVFLDSRILTTPPVAVQQTEKECARLASLARASFDLSMEALLNGDAKAIARVEENELTVDKLTHGITKYIVKINGLDIMDYDRKVMGAMYNAIQDLERIGDRSENICEAAKKMIDGEAVFSDKAMKEIRSLCEVVSQILEDSFYMFTNQSKDPNLTEAVLQAEDQIDEYCELFRQNHVNRLSKGECNAEAGALFVELITNLERIGDHAVTVAFCIPYKNHNIIAQQQA
ncbi:MAG: Na/Pi cotransporter family protein [Ruminococcus sp.]|nr:Na/Pi cotransporter family protein [Ruminococcus sp.]